MNTKQLKEKYLKTRVRYDKTGSRKGWKGTIQSIDTSNVVVLWDNGVEQSYRLDALIHPREWGPSYYPKYLTQITTEPYKETKLGPFLVVTSEGQYVDSFEHRELAITFASEQVIDAPSFKKMFIYSRECSVQRRKPKIDVIEEDTHDV